MTEGVGDVATSSSSSSIMAFAPWASTQGSTAHDLSGGIPADENQPSALRNFAASVAEKSGPSVGMAASMASNISAGFYGKLAEGYNSVTRSTVNLQGAPSQSNSDSGAAPGGPRGEEETQGLLSKGWAYATALSQSTQQRLDDSGVSQAGATRWMYFGLLMAIGFLFLFLASLFLPVLVIAPQKFSLLFTFGSLFIIAGCATLKGWKPFLSHCLERHRLPFSAAYVTSLVLTLYGTLIVKSYILAVVFAGVQVACLITFLASYVPGGLRALGYVKDAFLSLVKRLIRSSTSDGAASGSSIV